MGNKFKGILVWIGAFAIIPNAYLATQSAGYDRIFLILLLVCLFTLLWCWKDFLNAIRNTETVHEVFIFNTDGDVKYHRITSYLPFLWAKKESEIGLSVHGKDAKIENVEINCPVEWSKKEDKVWLGIARLVKHYPLLFAFGRQSGTRIEINSIWRKEYTTPHDGFPVACGLTTSSKIQIRLRWAEEVPKPIVAYGQIAHCPIKKVRKEMPFDISMLPWKTIKELNIQKYQDKTLFTVFDILNPKPNYMYRIYWTISE